MGIFNELDRMLNEESLEDLLRGDVDADENPEMDDDSIGGEEGGEEEGEEELTDLMKYHKSLQKMIDFIDGLTEDGENNQLAFDVEESLRDAMDKLVKLNDAVYKGEKGEEKDTEEE